jgi:putative transposase
MSDPPSTIGRMTRLARAVVPGLPHHLTQRGNRRQQTFFGPDDYLLYLALLGEWCRRFSVDVWAYCLMPNHVHLVAVPATEDGFRHAIGRAHRKYTLHVNAREGWRGHLWQGRFASFPMDERYTVAAARYVELNPVRANLVARPEDYPWSSARAHLLERDDSLVRVAPLLARVADWPAFLREGMDSALADRLRKHQNTGRPLGSEAFVGHLETLLGRILAPRKPGPPARTIATGPTCEPSRVADANLVVVSGEGQQAATCSEASSRAK